MADDVTESCAEEGGTSRRHMLTGIGVAAGGILALGGNQQAQATVSDASYYSYGPIRYVDTRSNSGGRIYGGQTRTLSIFSGLQSYTFALNVTVIDTKGTGGAFLALYNADLSTRPSPYSTISWLGSGKIVSNFTLLDLGSAGAKVFCAGNGSTHFYIDVVGYFYTGGAASSTSVRPLPADLKAAQDRVQRQSR